MSPHVHLMPTARSKLPSGLHEQVGTELAAVFCQAEEISVYDVLQGFDPDPLQKVVLAVETQSRAEGSSTPVFEPHVVKLGERSHVADDVLGWQRCICGRQMSQRMFVPVRLYEDLGRPGRAAVVYHDAAQWYGLLAKPTEEVATLAWAAERAVFTPDIDTASVERVIRQVCRELGRCFYRDAREDPASATAFYRSRLRLDGDPSVVERWRHGDLWLLRRDVDWLLCGSLSPAGPEHPQYVDPCDFALWALSRAEIPATLVGPSHGDLHARNVVVGVAGTEVEYPLLIDYGDMAPDNVVAWDFAKLETELKVRLLARLFDSRDAREMVWGHVRGGRFQKLVQCWRRGEPGDDALLVDRTQQVLFAFEFERQLHDRTALVECAPRRFDGDRPAGQTPWERALSIVQTIRALAAEQLGRAGNRSRQWRDELNFAIAVYGLNTVKFSDGAYPLRQRVFAAVSAGVAAARLETVRRQVQHATTSPLPADGRWPTYHLPLRRAYHQWQANRQLDDAERLMQSAAAQFDYAVTFRREHALLQSKTGKTAAAEENIRGIGGPAGTPGQLTELDLVRVCSGFLEIELLSRLGRIYKDKADRSWGQNDRAFAGLSNLPPVQYYRAACHLYRKAFEMSRDYYPGGNAAVTGWLASEPDALEIARAVAAECETLQLSALSPADRYWVLTTEGDMCLLLGDSGRAAHYYRTALEELPAGNDGMVQTTYDQLCRLYRALGSDRVRPVLAEFRKAPRFILKPGPLGDCGGL